MADTVKVISNTEVSTFNTCERRWFYAHYIRLMPIKFSQSLSRGLLGHEALAAYYNTLLQGGSEEEAKKASTTVLMVEAIRSDSDMEMIDHLRLLLNRYYQWAKEFINSFEIIEVEKSYILPLTSQYAYGMRLDLLAKMMNPGKYCGEVCVIDHKFTYDFWKLDDLRINPQIPKYIGVLRTLGHPEVNYGFLNQLRYRHKLVDKREPEDLFQRDPIEPSARKVRSIFTEQIKASERIIKFYEMSPEQAEDSVLRSMNKMNCKNCPFLDLCVADLEGSDTTLMKQTWFMPNTYGYSPESETV